ncbi:hypothetical protein OK016_19090 [Vibrio chagasii]|nr:hypothetical protein [Vibrio chagasii]
MLAQESINGANDLIKAILSEVDLTLEWCVPGTTLSLLVKLIIDGDRANDVAYQWRTFKVKVWGVGNFWYDSIGSY